MPGGEPRIRLQIASRATLMFWKLPRMWIRVSASTMRVRVAFSIVNLVLPLWGEGDGGVHRAAGCDGALVVRGWAVVA